jgi:hypothetical protein
MSTIGKLKAALGIAKVKAPNPAPTLNIATDSARVTQEKLCGGWAVTLAAFPHSRPQVEHWLCEALDRLYAAEHARDKAEAAAWELAVHDLSSVLTVSAHACSMRALAAARKEQTLGGPSE